MTTDMGPSGINIDFLRSGKQFLPNQVAANTRQTGNSSSHGRLEEFYAKTLEAFLTSTQSQSQQQRRRQQHGINIGLLRSGRQFVTPKESIPSIARKTARKTANSRLEEFHTKMLEACQNQKVGNKAESGGQGTATINIEALRSGRQFVTPPESTFTPSPTQGRNTRLELFYNKTLKSHNSQPPNGINIEALRSGRQFVTPPESAFTPSPTHGRHARLESFYNKTLKSHNSQPPNGINIEALRSGRQFVTPPESTFTPSTTHGRHAHLESFYNKTLKSHNAQPPNGINIDALRSGRQFVTPLESAFTPSPTRGRHARLESFYARGLAAVKALPTTTNLPQPINLDFIRSGQEFQGATAQSPEAKRWDGFKTKGKHARLELFHDSMLKAFAKSITPTLLSQKDSNEISHLETDKARGINLDFIRSGQEFSGATASSPESRRWDRFKTSGRQTRLERFHEETLKAHSLPSRTM